MRNEENKKDYHVLGSLLFYLFVIYREFICLCGESILGCGRGCLVCRVSHEG